jgi:PAS domain S-box-containing protein
MLASSTLAFADAKHIESDSAPEKNVLVLYSFSDREHFAPVDSLKADIRSKVSVPVNFYVEYMESQRLEDPEYEVSFGETLKHSHGRERLDLVVVAAFPALRFALRYRDAIFPGVPIVFSNIYEGRIRGQKLWPGVTGVTLTGDVPGTIALARKLHPGANTVAIIGGTTEFETYWVNDVHSELDRSGSKLKVVDLIGLSSRQLVERTSALPLNTIVLHMLSPRESTQPAVGPYESLAEISRRLPTYSIFTFCLGHGCIGGSYWVNREQGRLTAKIASHILSGEKPENVPVEHDATTQVQVDGRELRKWNLSEAALPAGSLILFQEPTLWQRHKGLIVAGVLGGVAQAFWIAALLWQRRKTRKALATLTESEERFQRMADIAPALIWMSDSGGSITYLNEKRLEFAGNAPGAGLGDTWTQYIHPDDLPNVQQANARAQERREGFSKEYRIRRQDGVYRWMFDVASPRTGGDGSFAGFVGSAIDVTEQKLAQEALEGVSGRLIEAQEKERSRIARELHDDICQRLALLSLELEQAIQRSDSAKSDGRWPAIQLQCTEIAGDVQVLSHELHSSKLDYLGLKSAAASFCHEFSKQHGVAVDFEAGELPGHLSREISLCLFRIVQEALHNGVKHSGASRFRVCLIATPDRINLEIGDAGIGFDVDRAMKGNGLGLVSMQERIHVVNGSFSIESKPNRGTIIRAAVPLNTKRNSLSAAAGAA